MRNKAVMPSMAFIIAEKSESVIFIYEQTGNENHFASKRLADPKFYL